MTPYSDTDLEAMMADRESDLVERKPTVDGHAPSTVRQAICAFANDLPDHRRPGVIYIGVNDDGVPTGLEVNDAQRVAIGLMRSTTSRRPPRSRNGAST